MNTIDGTACLSACGRYRWRLDRDLGRDGPVLAGIMVNPSKATASVSDQTINKWLGFASRLGAGRFIVGNKFAWRATDIRGLQGVADPVGAENDQYLETIMREADRVIVAWGTLSKLPLPMRSRWRDVAAIAQRVGKPLWCFGTAKDGHPLHPLMLAYDTPLSRWSPPQ